ncbi:MAG: hypothetical protein C4331_04180, partial [Meiothermus sp.]
MFHAVLSVGEFKSPPHFRPDDIAQANNPPKADPVLAFKNGGGLMRSRLQKFLSYYKPYRRILTLDLICAFVVAAITLIFPLCVSLITKNILVGDNPDALRQIYMVGALMLGLVALHALCNFFVDFQGHM